jgi:Protein of unknown function (DUF1553)/Protein of unknown function (DUF1549)/Planctomycete cytochrome C/F5/8 type C domain
MEPKMRDLDNQDSVETSLCCTTKATSPKSILLERVAMEVNRNGWFKIKLLAFACLQCICIDALADGDFEKDILPILNEHCIECHGPNVQESKLRLDTMLFAMRGGNSGEPIVTPGDSRRSHLIERLTTCDPKLRMPPGGEPLAGIVLNRLRDWIDNEPLWKESKDQLEARTTDHWSFQPIKRPDIPVAKDTNTIDVFIGRKLQDSGLSMSDRADKRRLIRRLYLVMHGLPPTKEQVDRFVSDERPDAWPRLVEEVLASPRYGERWASHWLDLVRFGETNGFETNRERTTAYPYRDWVITSFNTDKPYDQFVKQQIAGDALGEPIGTAFLVAGPNDIVKGQDPLLGLMQRQDELADIVNTTGTAFLGLTTGCARCHNHKFDPISQTDYYAMQAVFAGVEHGEQTLPLSSTAKAKAAAMEMQIQQLRATLAKYTRNQGTREPVNAVENTERFAPVEAKWVRFTILATNAAEPCIDELQIFSGEQNVALRSVGSIATSSGNLDHPLHKLEQVNDGKFGNPQSWIANTIASWVQIEFAGTRKIDRIVWGRDHTGHFADRVVTEYQIETSLNGMEWQTVANSEDRLPITKGTVENYYDFKGLPEDEANIAMQTLNRIQSLSKEREQLLSANKVYSGTFFQPPATHRMYRGDPTAPKEQVAPDAIRVLGSLRLAVDTPEQARRVAVANWIASPTNPLTARVLVNRLWQFHFGVGIVDTPSDFGANGTPPSHPELLDWLASEFIDQGWSMKKMHRLILTSNTWQQDSRPRVDAMQVDAGSRLLWRFAPRRLEAEGIRDCILAATGKLDLSLGGPGFSAFEIAMENVRHYFPKQEYGPADWRRMIYMTKVRQEKDSTFGVFDCPDGSQVTPKRSRSTTPLQALNLLNSRFVMQQSELLVERLARESDGRELKIACAFELCFGREANEQELALAGAFVAEHGWMHFARAMLNANEFVFIP